MKNKFHIMKVMMWFCLHRMLAAHPGVPCDCLSAYGRSNRTLQSLSTAPAHLYLFRHLLNILPKQSTTNWRTWSNSSIFTGFEVIVSVNSRYFGNALPPIPQSYHYEYCEHCFWLIHLCYLIVFREVEQRLVLVRAIQKDDMNWVKSGTWGSPCRG